MADTENDDQSKSEELADTRTDWAEDRTVLANERTFAAWMRTGMACIALALGLRAVFSATDYPLVAKAVAELFVGCAILIFWAAAKRSQNTQRRMDANDTNVQSGRNMIITAVTLTVGAVATGIILWLL
ncbi:YidH family protein [Sulfitobacter sp. JB4-11]|uniref:YidH family protein n=1 Tax=Sulfitobacter rhodophyticola TaxID=3238304 RepID=UPI0035161356